VPQAEIQLPSRVVAVDRLFAEFGVVAEFDGAVKYTGPESLIVEKEREWGLRDLGLLVVRWTGRELFARPHLVGERLGRALRGRGWVG
jgi:hypothetical protein